MSKRPGKKSKLGRVYTIEVDDLPPEEAIYYMMEVDDREYDHILTGLIQNHHEYLTTAQENAIISFEHNERQRPHAFHYRVREFLERTGLVKGTIERNQAGLCIGMWLRLSDRGKVLLGLIHQNDKRPSWDYHRAQEQAICQFMPSKHPAEPIVHHYYPVRVLRPLRRGGLVRPRRGKHQHDN